MKIPFSFFIFILFIHGAIQAQKQANPQHQLQANPQDTVLITYEEDGSIHNRISLKDHKRNGLSYLYLEFWTTVGRPKGCN